MRLPELSIIIVRALAEAVERVATQRQPEQVERVLARFFEQAGIERSALSDIHARLALPDFRRVVHAAVSVSGEPALGLQLGEQASLGAFDVIGVLAEQSDCLRDALGAALQYQRIISTAAVMQLSERDDYAIISLEFPRRDDPEIQFASELATSGLLRLIRMFVSFEALPRRAAFRYALPPHGAAYARRFGGTARFSQTYTGLEIERAWLECKKIARENELHAYLKTRADLLLARADQRMTTTDRVRRWLAAQPIAARMPMDAVARELGTSKRSLRRRLQAECVQWSALLAEALAENAKRLLADPHHSIEQTAYTLGFTSASAFSRAFKRWTGKAPSDFRSDS